jgi:methionyl-tRNA synthetase
MHTTDPHSDDSSLVTHTVQVRRELSAQLAAAAAREGASVEALAALWLEEHSEEAKQPGSTIDIDTFARVDLRVGQVLLAERVPNADKLLRLEVDLAEPQPRQILAGIAEWYAPHDLVGRKILVVANLQPRTLRGLESRGMLLAASDADGCPRLASVPAETPNGARLR